MKNTRSDRLHILAICAIKSKKTTRIVKRQNCRKAVTQSQRPALCPSRIRASPGSAATNTDSDARAQPGGPEFMTPTLKENFHEAHHHRHADRCRMSGKRMCL